MKWYSVNRYTPPACQNVFIRAVTTDECGNCYDRYFVGMIEDFISIRKLSCWEPANGKDFGEIDANNYTVTHFAIIEPVEMEL
jgi:hypothetical protein